MAYVAFTTRPVGYLFDADDWAQMRENFAQGLPDLYAAKGNIAAATAAQTMDYAAVAANGTALVASSDADTGIDWAGGTVPVGMIILWSGAVGAIPTGWQLCNGTNGTIDLRDKFVVGAGSTYAVGDNSATGTNLAHTHAATQTSGADATNHNHTQSVTATASAHTHTWSGTTDAEANSQDLFHGAGTGYAAFTHTHTFSGTTGAATTHSHTNPTTGDAAPNHTHDVTNTDSSLTAYLPQYYALCYIQRTS